MSITNPTSYTEARAALDRMADESTQHKATGEQCVADLRAVQGNLQAMQTNWAAAVAFIQSQAAANPTDDVWQRMAGEKEKVVADFIATRDSVNAIVAAVDAV